MFSLFYLLVCFPSQLLLFLHFSLFFFQSYFFLFIFRFFSHFSFFMEIFSCQYFKYFMFCFFVFVFYLYALPQQKRFVQLDLVCTFDGNITFNQTQFVWLQCYVYTLSEEQIKTCCLWMIELEHVIKKDNEYVRANIRLWLLLSSRGNIYLSEKTAY